MPVNGRRLFLKLLPELGISAVCDVGSLNGDEALAFRAVLPRAALFAFEASPENLGRMCADPALRRNDIEIVSSAVTNFDGGAEFFIVDADDSAPDERQGMSSLHKRPDLGRIRSRAVPVKTTRLDTFFRARLPPDLRLALWIDVEGRAYEVIEGLGALASRVHLLHVEVETEPCIAPGQRLYPEVLALLEARGFRELAVDGDRDAEQFNALFVRMEMPAETLRQVERQHRFARARLLVAGTLRKVIRAAKTASGQRRAPAARPPALPARPAAAYASWYALARKLDSLPGGIARTRAFLRRRLARQTPGGVAVGVGVGARARGTTAAVAPFVERVLSFEPPFPGPLDELLGDQGVAPSDVRVLEVEVEGSAKHVLAGARRVLEEGSPLVILVLAADTAAARADLQGHLGRMGYVLVHVGDGDGDGDGATLCFARYQEGEVPRVFTLGFEVAWWLRSVWLRS
jgi:FkbM family methyltransferase